MANYIVLETSASFRRATAMRFGTNNAAVDLPVRPSDTKSISGRVYDASGAVVSGATVVLVRQEDNLLCATMVTGADGIYLFPRRDDDFYEYYTIAYSLAGGATQVHGTSNRGLVAS